MINNNVKIVYIVKIVESVGRYNTHMTTNRAFVVDSSLGFFALQKALLTIENIVSFEVLRSYPASELDLDTKNPNSFVL